MKIFADQSACIASGQCTISAPNVFNQRDDGIVELQTDRPTASEHEAAREAATLCPAAAIRISDDH